MGIVNFSKTEKQELFDYITSHFYNSNFGQMSKADIELLFFHIYLDKLVNDNTSDDGTIDYRRISDYRISKDLGITQQRVRNLKVKCQLKYPIEYKWEPALAKLIKNARYDKHTKKVIINIPDPNLYLDIQNFIEEKGAFVEKQLNSKILQLRAEYYIDLVLALENDDNRKKIIRSIKKTLKESGKDDEAFDDSEIGKSLIDAAVNVTTVAANISGLVSAENVIGKALLALLVKKA